MQLYDYIIGKYQKCYECDTKPATVKCEECSYSLFCYNCDNMIH
jgi:hypothetical protein